MTSSNSEPPARFLKERTQISLGDLTAGERKYWASFLTYPRPIQDRKARLKDADGRADLKGLFDHQIDAVFFCEEMLAEKRGLCVLGLPTGMGKTWVIASLMMRTSGLSVVFVPSSLVLQTRNEIKKVVDMIGGGERSNESGNMKDASDPSEASGTSRKTAINRSDCEPDKRKTAAEAAQASSKKRKTGIDVGEKKTKKSQSSLVPIDCDDDSSCTPSKISLGDYEKPEVESATSGKELQKALTGEITWKILVVNEKLQYACHLSKLRGVGLWVYDEAHLMNFLEYARLADTYPRGLGRILFSTASFLEAESIRLVFLQSFSLLRPFQLPRDIGKVRDTLVQVREALTERTYFISKKDAAESLGMARIKLEIIRNKVPHVVEYWKKMFDAALDVDEAEKMADKKAYDALADKISLAVRVFEEATHFQNAEDNGGSLLLHVQGRLADIFKSVATLQNAHQIRRSLHNINFWSILPYPILNHPGRCASLWEEVCREKDSVDGSLKWLQKFLLYMYEDYWNDEREGLCSEDIRLMKVHHLKVLGSKQIPRELRRGFRHILVRVENVQDAIALAASLREDTSCREEVFLMHRGMASSKRHREMELFCGHGEVLFKVLILRRALCRSKIEEAEKSQLSNLALRVLSKGDVFDQITSFLSRPRILVADGSVDVGVNLHRYISNICSLSAPTDRESFNQLLGRASRIAAPPKEGWKTGGQGETLVNVVIAEATLDSTILRLFEVPGFFY